MKTYTFSVFCLFALVILTANSCKKHSNSKYIFNKDSLVAYYPLNGNAHDTLNNANNGIVHGATLTRGRYNNKDGAYMFNGYNSYIQLPSNIALNSDSCFSIEAWIDNYGITSDGKYTDNAIYGQTDGYSGSDYPIVMFYINKHDSVIGAVRGVSNPVLYAKTADTIKNNVWNHVVLVRNAHTHSLKIYVNGDLYANDSLRINGNTISNKFVAIGGFVDDLQTVYHFFYGKIGLVRIWKEALSQQEIIELMNGNFEIK